MKPELCEMCGLPITKDQWTLWRGSRRIRHWPVEQCFPVVRAELERLNEELQNALVVILDVKRERDEARAENAKLQERCDCTGRRVLEEELTKMREAARKLARLAKMEPEVKHEGRKTEAD